MNPESELTRDSIRYIKSNPLSSNLSELMTAYELIKMNDQLIVDYPSLEDALKLIGNVIESEL